MGCYDCGSEQGDALSLCPACIKKRACDRAQRLSDLRSTQPIHDPLYKLSKNIFVRLALIIGAFLFLTHVFMQYSPVEERGEPAVTLFALMSASYTISLVLWLLFWFDQLIKNFLWGLACVVFPPLVYRLVFILPQEYKLLFVVQVSFIAAAIVLTFFVKSHLGLPMDRMIEVFVAGLLGEKAYLESMPTPFKGWVFQLW